MWFALALSIAIVAYNNLINRWEPFHRVAYVPANLTFTTVIALVAAATLGLSRTDMGLEGDASDAGMALATVAAFAIGALAFTRSRHSYRIADKRVRGLRGVELVYHLLARIPLGTAVAEEVIFRGVLFAAWRDARMSTLGAALCTSFVFGLWHISPTIIGIRLNDPQASGKKLSVGVIAAVLLTTAVGLVLTWLRLRNGGLIAPIVLHGGINSVSALAAVLASRRGDSKDR